MADDWYTPKSVFDRLGVEFDIDVCSPVGGTGFVWMNPPYSCPTRFVDKFIEHNNGIALVPFSKSNWFIKLWNKSDAMCPIEPNIKFERPTGKPTQLFLQLVLVGMGSKAYETITNAGINRIR